MDKQEVVEHLKDALSHLNDVATLADSPLALALPASAAGAESTTRGTSRGVQLRNLLYELIENVKPSPEVPETAPEWRQYLILHDRYVLHRPLWEIEHKLTIGERQVRREHGRGLAILAEMLRARLSVPEMPVDAQTLEPATTPREAIQRLVPVSRVFGLAQLVEDVVSFLSVAGKVQPNQVQIDIDPDDLTVSTDPGILRQLLTNLLLALGPMTVNPLQFTASLTHAQVVVNLTEVVDGDARLIDLAGEGMALCQLLAHSIGADITVAQPRMIHFALPPGSRLRKVLVIDDELAAAELYQSYVIGLDYQVIAETNAEEAVARALEVQPDAIMLDVMMPAMDGWELLQRLRHSPPLRDIPIIVCSVLSEADLAASLGASAFLKKPLLRSQLVKTLGEATGWTE